jgi:hypothetical protein
MAMPIILRQCLHLLGFSGIVEITLKMARARDSPTALLTTDEYIMYVTIALRPQSVTESLLVEIVKVLLGHCASGGVSNLCNLLAVP